MHKRIEKKIKISCFVYSRVYAFSRHHAVYSINTKIINQVTNFMLNANNQTYAVWRAIVTHHERGRWCIRSEPKFPYPSKQRLPRAWPVRVRAEKQQRVQCSWQEGGG